MIPDRSVGSNSRERNRENGSDGVLIILISRFLMFLAGGAPVPRTNVVVVGFTRRETFDGVF